MEATAEATEDVRLLPSGSLLLGDHAASLLPPGIAKAFGRSSAEGLLALATEAAEEPLPPGLAFWRRFAHEYLTRLCQAPPEALDGRDDGSPAPLPGDEELDETVDRAPPAPGMEYLSAEVLARVWDALDEHVAEACGGDPAALEEWLRQKNPLWNLVGRVTFHLAENRRNDEFPFAFLATYTHRIGSGGRLQYLPLGKALAAYAGRKNTRALRALLAPVQRAADADPLARELLDSRRVFHALAWTPREAHRFIQSIPAFEEAGLIVKVPDWWKGKAPVRPMVSVELDAGKRTTLGLGSLLAFRVEVALEGEALTPEEWQAILESDSNLVSIKGRWVEVDKEKLTQVLEQWRRAEAEAMGSGVGFLQGMRLLAGLRGLGGGGLGALDEALAIDGGGDWTRVTAGGRLRDVLRGMRDPASLEGESMIPGLEAELRPYQSTGVAWLWFLGQLGLGACLADDMGLGKTLQVIAVLLRLKAGASRRGRGAAQPPSLLVVPASLVGNWRAEIERFGPSLEVFYAHRSQASAEELAAFGASTDGCDAVVTTYSMLGRLDGLAERDWDLVVLDEAQAIKNPRARQTREVKALRARARIALTGTPIENSAGDLWSLFDFLNPGLLGSASRFKEVSRHFAAEGGPGFAPLRRLVSPYILRRLKTDRRIIDDLPDKTEVRCHAPLTKGQATLYQKSVRELAAQLRDPAVEGIQRSGLVLSFLMRFKQICDHPALWTGSGNFGERDSGKFRRLREIAEEVGARGEKVLVFTQFREMTAPLADFLESVFGRPGLLLHGGTAVRRRQRLVDQFQSEAGPPFFVISLKAGGTGLNLTAASHVVHFDRWWNPAVENQATDRAFRIGQHRNVLVHKFVCPGTVEEKIDALIEEKKALAEDLLGAGAEKLLTELEDDALLDFVSLDLDSAVF